MLYQNVSFDISPRRSGKTTRLIQAVISHLMSNAEHTADIVCFFSVIRNQIYDTIIELYPNLSNRMEFYSDEENTLHGVRYHHIQNHNNMIFFDESDLIRHKFLYERCYYGTTDTNNSTLQYRDTNENNTNTTIILNTTDFFTNNPFIDETIGTLSRELSDDVDYHLLREAAAAARRDTITYRHYINDDQLYVRRVLPDEDNMTLDEPDEDEEDYPDLDETTDEEYFLHRIGAK